MVFERHLAHQQSAQLGSPDEAGAFVAVLGRGREELVDEAEQALLTVSGQAMSEVAALLVVTASLVVQMREKSISQAAHLFVKRISITGAGGPPHVAGNSEQVEVRHRWNLPPATLRHLTGCFDIDVCFDVNEVVLDRDVEFGDLFGVPFRRVSIGYAITSILYQQLEESWSASGGRL